MEQTLLIITGTLTALLAGVFFGFAVAVNGGLHRLQDGEYIRAMQAINVVIQNPLFFLSFMGPVALLPAVTYLSRDNDGQFLLLAIATGLYVFVTFGLTIVGNVPLNDKLAKLDTQTASASDRKVARTAYEQPWNRLHAIRTIAAIAATVLIFVASTR
jgi:uncharacterized membrane protein